MTTTSHLLLMTLFAGCVGVVGGAGGRAHVGYEVAVPFSLARPLVYGAVRVQHARCRENDTCTRGWGWLASSLDQPLGCVPVMRLCPQGTPSFYPACPVLRHRRRHREHSDCAAKRRS